MKKHRITAIDPGSIAEEMGVEPGWYLLSVGGKEIEDIFDYELLCGGEYLEVLLEDDAGEQTLLEIEKEENEPLGFRFDGGLMDEYRSCRNKCIFCFIDQMPPGMRETLYFKDDDSRLSYLQGNYVTLTNMSDRDIERIIEYHLWPINISVHTMDPALRCRMLNNRFAGEALKKIDTLAAHHVVMNGQIVLCPGWNDGPELDNTIGKLSRYLPWMESVSVVPVGLTKYREGLTPLRLMTKEEALETVATVERWQEKLFREHGTHFIHASDEIYRKAGLPLPEEARYDGYPQLENGVGMLRLFIDQFRKALKAARRTADLSREVSIATGLLAAPVIETLLRELKEKYPNVTVHLYPIVNRFFGESITVSGLVTGQDLSAQLKEKPLGERLYIPRSMLRAGEDVFLDDIRVSEVSAALGVPVTAVECDGGIFLRTLIDPKNRRGGRDRFRGYELGGKHE